MTILIGMVKRKLLNLKISKIYFDMEVALYIVLGCVVGALVTWLILNARYRESLLKKSEELNGIKSMNSVLQANLDAQDKSFGEVKKSMLDTFKSAASDALLQNNKQFLDLAKPQLEAQVNASKGDLKKPLVRSLKCYQTCRRQMPRFRKRQEPW
jgi:hypothetical protein